MGPASRPRFVVVYQDRRLPLPDGEFVVGRALGCHIRFNAAEVSRQHVKLRVDRGRLMAENLSSTTGTLLNGRPMRSAVSLSHGDQLALGPRSLRIEVDEGGDAALSELSADDSGEHDADEQTRPGSLEHELGLGGSPTAVFRDPAASIPFHTCPKCRTKVAFGESLCAACGYAWSDSHPSSVTARVTLKSVGPPIPARNDLPVVYASEELTLDAVVEDLTPHRAFVPSPLLDPNNTSCELTLLPEGTHAMTLSGVVVSVRTGNEGRGPAGMEVRFTDVPAATKAWIDRWVAAKQKK